MELWILLAAAGSGYFAQCCRKNSQKRGEQSASRDRSHYNVDSSDNSHSTPSSKRRHHKLSSSSRRKDRKNKRKTDGGLHNSKVSIDGDLKTVRSGSLNGRDADGRPQFSSIPRNLNEATGACFPNSYIVCTKLNMQQCTYCCRFPCEVNNVHYPVPGRLVHSSPFYRSMCSSESIPDGRAKLGGIAYPPLEGYDDNFMENKAAYDLMDHVAFSGTQLLGGFWATNNSGFIRDEKNYHEPEVDTMSSLDISAELDEPDPVSGLNINELSKQPKDPFNEPYTNGDFEYMYAEDAVSTNQSEHCCQLYLLEKTLHSEAKQDINIELECNDRSPSSNRSFIQDTSNESSKSALFYFGVGVGIIFAILSAKRKLKELSALIKDSDSLLKDLYCELGGAKNSCCDFLFYTKDFSQDALVEQRNINAMLQKIRKVIDKLNTVEDYLSYDPDTGAIPSNTHSVKMARLEAELEAEFQIMEINFGNQESFCQCSTLSEVDSRVVQGDFTGDPYETGRGSEEEHCRDSSAEACHSGVSPVELERCLHEVLEARQEKYILQLEAELKLMHNRLQTKEDEIILWKERCLSFVPGKMCETTSQNDAEDDENLTPRSHCSPDSPVFESKRNIFNLASKHNVFQNALLSQNGPNITDTTYIALEGEALAAYNEAYDELLNSSVDAADSGPKSTALDTVSRTWTRVSPYADMPLKAKHEVSSHHLNTGTHGSSSPGGVIGCVKSEIELKRPKVIIGDIDNHDLFDCKNIHTQDMDSSIVGNGNTYNKAKMEDSSVSKPFSFDWCGGNVCYHSGSSSCIRSHDVIAEGHESHVCSGVEWSLSDDSSYSSDWDEQLGKLLISQIVEKSRRSSSIIEVAQSMLASFESDESPLSSD